MDAFSLLARADLDPDQRRLYDSMSDGALRWADENGFEAQTTDGRFIGPFNPSLLHPQLTEPFLRLQAAEEAHTTIDERTRQVIILSVGAIWNAPYELYAHSAVARAAGLGDDAIDTLVSGGLPQQLSGSEKLAHRLARQLSTEHRLDDDLYADAARNFGAKGILDIVLLVGIYDTVCGILSAFAIPAPEPAARKQSHAIT